MDVRRIVKIHEEKCNGCGLCIPKCHEGAIIIENGKAKLLEDKLCDGIGDCLGHCPQGAIEIIERAADEYDEAAVKERQEALKKVSVNNVDEKPMACGCPGSMAKKIEKKVIKKAEKVNVSCEVDAESTSELNQWPVQIKLVNPKADFFKGADILIAADCTAYAYGSFHKDFIKGRITLIGCPKLDDTDYSDKLAEIFRNDIKSITVVRMSVPCCSGIVSYVKKAILKSENIVPYNEVIIGLDGEIAK